MAAWTKVVTVGGSHQWLNCGYILKVRVKGFFFTPRGHMMSDRRGRVTDVTKTLSRYNGKNSIAINRDAGGTGEDGLRRRSGSSSFDTLCCDVCNSSTRPSRQWTPVSGAEGREGTRGDI